MDFLGYLRRVFGFGGPAVEGPERYSNAPLGYPKVSPEGFPLHYPGVPPSGVGVPTGPAWYVYDDFGHTCETVAEAMEAIARFPMRAKNLMLEQERWKKESFNGPVAVWTMTIGDQAYAARRAPDYGILTGGRSLFHDLCAGSNPDIAQARHNGEWNQMQGLPLGNPRLPAIIDDLIAEHRSK
jgi:hypothetical protein